MILANEDCVNSSLGGDRVADMDPARRFPTVVSEMTKAATAFLDSLEREQREVATAPFDVGDHKEWTYLPGDRPGAELRYLTAQQKALALELMDTACSAEGAQIAREVMDLDIVLRRPADRFWVRVLGTPGGDAPWGWRVNGHHLAIHVTVIGDALAVTPHFFGANPATVPDTGQRTLAGEEDIARTLLSSLDDDQRGIAVVAETAPDDILTRRDPVADPAVVPAGLAYAQMYGEQRELLERLVRHYFGRVRSEAAAVSWQEAVDAGLDVVRFAWAGPGEPGRGHYYAVKAPTFLLEYDKTQDNANHIHAVWRDLRNDWGEDLLARHYADHHH